MLTVLDTMPAQIFVGIGIGVIPAIFVGLMVHRLGLRNPDPAHPTPSGVVGSTLWTWAAFAAWTGGLTGRAPDLSTFPWAAWGAGVCTFVGLAGAARADAAAAEMLVLAEARVAASSATTMTPADFARITRAVRGGIRALTALALVALWVDVIPQLARYGEVINELLVLAVNLGAAVLMLAFVLVAMDALESPEAHNARKVVVPLALLLAALTVIGGIGVAAGIALLAVLWWERSRILPWLREVWCGVRLLARFDGGADRVLVIDGQPVHVKRIGALTTLVEHADGERTWRNSELLARVTTAS